MKNINNTPSTNININININIDTDKYLEKCTDMYLKMRFGDIYLKKMHPVMYYRKQLKLAVVVSYVSAIVGSIMMSVFHFIFGLKWSDAMLACVAVALAVLCTYVLITFFTNGKETWGRGRWILRGLAVVMTILFITLVVMYFACLRPACGA